MGHQVIKLQNPLKTLGFLQFYRFKTVKDRDIIAGNLKSVKGVFKLSCQRKFHIPTCIDYSSPRNPYPLQDNNIRAPQIIR